HGIEIATMEEVLAQSDVVVATTGRPGLIKPEMVRRGQVILALTNPVPEIFRGALMAGASQITTDMKLAAAWALAGLTIESELVPDPLDRSVHDAVAEAVRACAVENGLGHPDRVPPALQAQ